MMLAKRVVRAVCAALLLLSSLPVRAQEAPKDVDLGALAREVSGTSGSAEERARRLVRWINTNFEWSYTDYQKRTVEEIVRRRAGNCAELATVLCAMLDAPGLRARWVAEINVQARNEQRLRHDATRRKIIR